MFSAMIASNPLIHSKQKFKLNSFRRLVIENFPEETGVWQKKRNALKAIVSDHMIWGDGDARPYEVILKTHLEGQKKSKHHKRNKQLH